MKSPPLHTDKKPPLPSNVSVGNHTKTSDEYVVTVITPIYGGGTQKGNSDDELPIRVGGILYQLRFWWRLLKWHELDGNWNKIYQQESELFGAAAQDKKSSGKCCKVRLRIKDLKTKIKSPYQTAQLSRRANAQPGQIELVTDRSFRPYTYVLFPAQGELAKDKTQIKKQPASLLLPDLSFTLSVSFLTGSNEAQKDEIRKAICWWASFGGIGARTRRGCGSLRVYLKGKGENSDNILCVDDEEIKKYCQIRKKASEQSAMNAWKTVIRALHTFRQGDGVGRKYVDDKYQLDKEGNPRRLPKRSHWPEADTIRNIVGHYSPGHQPKYEGNLLPRAMFGMPINFQFPKDVRNRDPYPCSIKPSNAERLASPLILKAMVNRNGTYSAIALQLPDGFMEDFANMNILFTSEMEKGRGELDGEGKKNIPREVWWPSDSDYAKEAAHNISPLKNHLKSAPYDALSAFMNFFETYSE